MIEFAVDIEGFEYVGKATVTADRDEGGREVFYVEDIKLWEELDDERGSREMPQSFINQHLDAIEESAIGWYEADYED